jgi:hypothetical protein
MTPEIDGERDHRDQGIAEQAPNSMATLPD